MSKPVAFLFLLIVALSGDPLRSEEPIFVEDFENGLQRWELIDSSWELAPAGGGTALQITQRQSDYEPPHRSPLHLALVRGVEVEDFDLTFRVRSTLDTGNHRDCCVFFGYQSPERFYYVHLGALPDPASGQIMIVDSAARRPLTENTRPVPWDDGWHTVKLERRAAAGTIRIYFDDMDKPLMETSDKTFGSGRVGIGSFDDCNAFDDIRLESVR